MIELAAQIKDNAVPVSITKLYLLFLHFMKKFAFVPLMVWALQLFGQTQQCGTTFQEQLLFRDRLKKNIEFAETHGIPDVDITYIPVFFHLTADANGVGRATFNDIVNAMCTLNADYAEHDIQFYLSPHPTLGLVDMTINNNTVYNSQTNNFLMNSKRHNNAINYFVVGTAASNNNQPGGAAAYYTSVRDWIVANKAYMGLGDNTLSHETGHFFSLNHTFFGWESDAEDWENQPPCFDSGDPGWPCAPVFAPAFSGSVQTEKADGSNCSVASDMICDTPPDYNFGYCQNGCGAYTGGAKDPNCQDLNPMENNFMSYFFNCSDYEFTQGQVDAMKADILSTSRNFLDNTFVPVATSITTPADLLVSPADAEVVQDATSAVLTWNAVPGATHYYVEVDRTTTFTSALGQSHIVTNANTLTVTGLTANKKYYWRVRPFNQYYLCAAPRTRTFNTNTVSAVNTIEQVNDWTVAPNPTDAGQEVSIILNTNAGMDLNLRLTDAAGRVVYSQNGLYANEGQSVIALPTHGLAAGVYFVQLQSGSQVETRRLSVL